MSIDIRFPNITATTAEGQMAQMQSYMHQLVQQLNWALSTIETSNGTATASPAIQFEQGKQISEKEAVDTFNSIKALIIKSADIVQAYEETISESFSGEYVAVSDFGTYTLTTDAKIEKNSQSVDEVYTRVEAIGDDVKNTNAYIKRGFLGYLKRLGKDVHGIAVGETDDKGVYNNYAWFTAHGISLFDESGNEVAYITQNKLHINDATFLGTVQFGGYKVDTSYGLAFTWIGKEE